MSQSHLLPEVSTGNRTATAQLQAAAPGGESLVKIGGDWRLNGPVPSWAKVLGKQTAVNVRVVPEDLGNWDTSLVLFLVHCRAWCAASKSNFHGEALPANLQNLLGQVPVNGAAKPASKATVKSAGELASLVTMKWALHVKQIVAFLGECTLGFIGEAENPRRFRWLDCLVEMQQCWASSLPMVSLVSFLVGVILAFQSAVQLQQFGAAIYVADLVGLSVVRELGPMMAAFIVAGGTGARFAAQLVGLAGMEELYPSELSGGMQKRAALARALALDPAIVFFDEPSEGLDPIISREMDELILQVRENFGTTMIIVSHQLSSIFRLANRVILLNHETKGIIAEGAPAELAATSTDPRVRDFLNQSNDLPKRPHEGSVQGSNFIQHENQT